MINFNCSSCRKAISLEKLIYEKVYMGYDRCLDCRPKHGGHREGAGRPALGITKKVSITLPDGIWSKIEKEKDDMALSAYLREIVLKHFGGSE